MPANPPVTTLDPARGLVRLDLSGLDQPGAALFTVYRHHLGSGVIVVVRGLAGVRVQGPTYSGFDYEVPIDSQVTYRVDLILNDQSTDTGPESAPPVLWTTTDAWLKDLGHPDRNIKVRVVGWMQTTWGLTPGVHRVLNRRAPVVVSDVRQAAQGVLTLATLSADEYYALLQVTADGTPLLFQAPLGYGIGSMYAAVADIVENRADRIAGEPARSWDLTMIEIDSPIGGTVSAGWTYGDVLDAWLDYQAVLDVNPTYLDLLIGQAAPAPAPRPPLPWRGQ